MSEVQKSLARTLQKIIFKLSDLNYRIVDKSCKETVVHVNRLKKAGNQELWETAKQTQPRKRKSTESTDDQEEEEIILSQPIPTAEGYPQQLPESPRNIADPPQTQPRNMSPQRIETPAVDREQPT
jgi:hypothetical protein